MHFGVLLSILSQLVMCYGEVMQNTQMFGVAIATSTNVRTGLALDTACRVIGRT